LLLLLLLLLLVVLAIASTPPPASVAPAAVGRICHSIHPSSSSRVLLSVSIFPGLCGFLGGVVRRSLLEAPDGSGFFGGWHMDTPPDQKDDPVNMNVGL